MSTNQEASNQEMNLLPVQETVLLKQVFDPNTGRTMLVDQNGKRVRAKKDMTGTQLVRLNSMRNQIGLPYLKEHNVTMMSIDSASLMIDDLLYCIAIMKRYSEKIQLLEETLQAWEQSPQATAQKHLLEQAERARAEKSPKNTR